MTIEDHLNMALSPGGFEAAKYRLQEEAMEIIANMQPEELRTKWLRGAATAKNKITDANLYQFPAFRNLIEELQDAFWYSVIRNAQKDD